MFGLTICAGVAIEDAVFEQREADAHDDAADALALGGERVDDRARSPARTAMRLTFVTPVSMSTSTSANCTPLVPPAESPACHSPSTAIGSVPSSLAGVLPRHALGRIALDVDAALRGRRASAGSTPSDGATRRGQRVERLLRGDADRPG